MFDGHCHIYQTCFVVDDIDKGIDNWIKTAGAGPFFLKRNFRIDNIEYYGSRCSLYIQLAVGQDGPFHIELIEDNGAGPTVYSDLHPRGQGGGLHHIGMLAKDFDPAVSAYRDAGFAVGTAGGVGPTKLSYIDTCSSLGLFTEFHQDNEDIRSLSQRIAQARTGWSGSRPVRPFAELFDS